MDIYDVLERIFHRFNEELFKGALGEALDFNDIVLTLERKNKQIGLLSYRKFKKLEDLVPTYKHQISLNPEYFAIAPKIDVLRVFCQELVRLYRYIYGEKEKMKTDYYDEHFGEYMMTIGLQPSNTGKMGGKEVGKKMSSYILPDGLFLSVCNGLVEDGILLNWFDVDIPSNVTVEDVLLRVYQLNEDLGESLSPVLMEVPLLQSKGILINELLPCLEFDPETNTIEIDEDLAVTNLVVTQMYENDDAVFLSADTADAIVTPTITRLEGEREWVEDDFIKDNLGVGKTMQYTSSDYDVDNEPVVKEITLHSTDRMSEVLGFKPPKEVRHRTKFKYTCGCEQTVEADRENMRFRCDICQIAFRCETEKLESITDVVEKEKPKHVIEGFDETHEANSAVKVEDKENQPA